MDAWGCVGGLVNPFARGIPIHYKEYYTSGFLSLQSAIEGYVLGLDSSSESSLGPLPAAQANVTWWTMWGSVMPTASWVHNECAPLPASSPALAPCCPAGDPLGYRIVTEPTHSLCAVEFVGRGTSGDALACPVQVISWCVVPT